MLILHCPDCPRNPETLVTGPTSTVSIAPTVPVAGQSSIAFIMLGRPLFLPPHPSLGHPPPCLQLGLMSLPPLCLPLGHPPSLCIHCTHQCVALHCTCCRIFLLCLNCIYFWIILHRLKCISSLIFDDFSPLRPFLKAGSRNTAKTRRKRTNSQRHTTQEFP